MKKIVMIVMMCLAGLVQAEVKDGGKGPGTVSFYPQKLLMKKNAFQGVFEFTNDSDTLLKYEVKAVKWENDKQTETDEVSASPMIFTLKPHSSNKIRVINKAPSTDVERTYRLIVNQLDVGQNKLGQSISFPVFIEPVLKEPKAPEFKQTGETVAVVNNGNMTQFLTKIVTNQGDIDTGMYITPKSQVTIDLKAFKKEKATVIAVDSSLITEQGLKKTQ